VRWISIRTWGVFTCTVGVVRCAVEKQERKDKDKENNRTSVILPRTFKTFLYIWGAEVQSWYGMRPVTISNRHMPKA
jgi:hypothetical protein